MTGHRTTVTLLFLGIQRRFQHHQIEQLKLSITVRKTHFVKKVDIEPFSTERTNSITTLYNQATTNALYTLYLVSD